MLAKDSATGFSGGHTIKTKEEGTESDINSCDTGVCSICQGENPYSNFSFFPPNSSIFPGK
jgi:hypothetical protein